MKNIALLKHQYEFIADEKTRYLSLVSGYRGGKSYSMSYKLIALASKNIGYEGAILSPTHSMLKRVMVPLIEQALKSVNLRYTYRSSDPHIFKIHFPTGDVIIHCLSAESFKRAAGLTLAFFGIDEFDLIKFDDAMAAWRMMVSRLTNGNVIQGCVTTTPEGFNATYHIWEELKHNEDGTLDTRKRLIKASTRDNPFIDDEYIDNLKSQYPEVLISAYIDGNFCNLSNGSVYYNFDRNTHHTNRELLSSDKTLFVGSDFNIGKCASVVCVYENNCLYVIDEIVDAYNTEDTIKIIKTRYPGKHIWIYPDASGNNGSTRSTVTDIALFRQAGFDVKCHNKNPFVKDRINSVNGLLKNAKGEIRLYINTKKCKSLTKSLEQQGYDDNGNPDKSKGLDHILDGLGYIIWYNFPITGKSTAKQIF